MALILGCTKKEETVAEKQEVVTAKELTPKEELGRRFFFDASLSTPEGQACSACHLPTAGWTGSDSNVNEKFAIYTGALKPRVGNRKPPTAAYAGFSPRLHRDEEGTFIGGMFWDGRAAGWTLDDPLAEQAMGPFINPLEMNMADKKSVILKVIESDYAGLFLQIWGADSLDAENDIDGTYERIARSIAAFERPFEGFVKAFTHNGYFKTLKEAVSFYNTRDTEGAEWPPPEIAENVNVDEMGDLGLTPEEEDLIVTFVKTLSDK